jgi:RHS repeat-associated protein
MSTTYRVLSDQLYRSVATVTTSNVVTEAYDTDAYGNTLCYSGPGTDGEWFTDDDVQTNDPINTTIFTGRQYDPESQIYYYRARYYSPEIGRFISRDPLPNAELSQGPNLYWYVRNNTANKVDPRGLQSLPAQCCSAADEACVEAITEFWDQAQSVGYYIEEMTRLNQELFDFGLSSAEGSALGSATGLGAEALMKAGGMEIPYFNLGMLASELAMSGVERDIYTMIMKEYNTDLNQFRFHLGVAFIAQLEAKAAISAVITCCAMNKINYSETNCADSAAGDYRMATLYLNSISIR